MATLNEKQAQLLLDPNFAVVGTVTEAGAPQTSVVWIDWDGESAIFTATKKRAKVRHLARNPRVSITVFDLKNPYRYVELEGAVELEDEGAAEHIQKMSQKYEGKDYSDTQPRVLVRLRPSRVHGMGVE